MTEGLRLLISSTPLWQQGAMDHPLPVHVQTVYMVMGQTDNKWQTILSLTDDLYAARDAMNGANDSKLFQRIVISQGRSVNKSPAAAWKTIECAVIPKKDIFADLLEDMRNGAANGNKSPLPSHAFLVGHKQSQNFLLGVALILAVLNQSPFALAIVGVLALVDCVFLLDNRPLAVTKTQKLNTLRNWAFATLNGVLLLVYLLSKI